MNKEAFEKLPADLQVIMRNAIRVANQDMLADFTAKNNLALEQLVNEQNVQLRKFPDDVLAKLKVLSDEVLTEEAASDDMTKKVYDSFVKFRDQATKWHQVSEQAYLNARNPL